MKNLMNLLLAEFKNLRYWITTTKVEHIDQQFIGKCV